MGTNEQDEYTFIYYVYRSSFGSYSAVFSPLVLEASARAERSGNLTPTRRMIDEFPRTMTVKKERRRQHDRTPRKHRWTDTSPLPSS